MSLLDLDDKPVPQTQPQPQSQAQPQLQPQATNVNWSMPFVSPPVQVQATNNQNNNQNWNWANASISSPINPQVSVPINPQLNPSKPPINQLNQGSNNNQFNLTGITFDSNTIQNKSLNLNQNAVNLSQVPKPPASNNLIDQFDDFQGGNSQNIQSPQKDNNVIILSSQHKKKT